MKFDQRFGVAGIRVAGIRGEKSGPTVTIQMKCTPGIDIEYHVENGEMVIDKSNVPLMEETKDLLCPKWMREIL